MTWRKSPQPLLPKRKPALPKGRPEINPSNRIAAGTIETGSAALDTPSGSRARRISG